MSRRAAGGRRRARAWCLAAGAAAALLSLLLLAQPAAAQVVWGGTARRASPSPAVTAAIAAVGSATLSSSSSGSSSSGSSTGSSSSSSGGGGGGSATTAAASSSTPNGSTRSDYDETAGGAVTYEYEEPGDAPPAANTSSSPISPSPSPYVTAAPAAAASPPPPSPPPPAASPPPAAGPPPPPATAARIAILGSNGSTTIRAFSGQPTSVTFDGSGSTFADAYDWSISQIRPTVQLLDLGLPTPQPASFSTILAAGEFLVMLRVTGRYGSSTAQALVTVHQNTIPIANAGGPYTSYLGRAITASAARSADGDGDALSYHWVLTLAGDANVLAEAWTCDAVFSPPRMGEYSLTLVVDDGHGGASATQADLTVLPAAYAPSPPPPPAWSPPMPPTTTPPPTTTTMSTVRVVAAAAASSPSPPPPPPPAPPPPPPPLSVSLAPNAGLSPASAPQCLFDKTTGVGVLAYDILAMPAITNVAAWANQEWRNCSSGPVKPLGAAASSGTAGAALAASLGTLSAAIAGPPAFVPTGADRTGRAVLNATGSAGAPLRPIVSYAWRVRRLPGGVQVASASGKVAAVTLPAGVYAATLTVSDLAGAAANASRVFAVWPVPETTAIISSPPPFVLATDGDGTRFLMSANGTMPAPGRNLTYFAWRVTSAPDGRVVASVAGYEGYLTLPTGKYSIEMAAADSGGGNSTAVKSFVIGASSDAAWPYPTETAVAATSLPPPAVAQAAGSGLTRVALDAAGSAAAAGAAVQVALWAVVSLPSRAAVANATGMVAEVWLPPGQYQVGLLISDSAGNTATVRKTFAIAPNSPSSTSSGAAPPAGTSSAVDTPPAFRADLRFAARAGSSLDISGVAADPAGGAVTLSWALMEVATGAARTGSGPSVPIPAGAPAGAYQLLITASDAAGGESQAVASVAVYRPAPPPPPVAAALPLAAKPPSIYGAPLAAAPKLPSRAFSQGAVLEVDPAASGAFDLTKANWRDALAAAACVFRLAPAAGGAAAAAAGGSATVYGCGAPARFRLGVPGSFRLTLSVTSAASGKLLSTQSSLITVNAKPFWSDYYTYASPQAYASGSCTATRFAASEFAGPRLSCGGVGLPLGWGADMGLDGARQALAFSWRLTPITARPAAAHKAPITAASSGGGAAAVGALAPGLYLAEVAGAAAAVAAGGSSSVLDSAALSAGAAYFLSALLVVEPSSKLILAAPKAACAGAAVQLAAPAPALLPGQSAGATQWTVARVSTSGGGAAAYAGAPLGGSGSSFSFVPDPGRYNASATVDVADGDVRRRLAGSAAFDVAPCLTCRQGPVALATQAAWCGVAKADAAKLLAAPQPAWLAGADIDFAPGSVLTPGTRQLAVMARSPALNVTATCAVKAVTIRDATPPAAKLRSAAGGCAAPANGKWACWPITDLVDASDACSKLRPIQYQTTCAPSAAAGCRVLKDGRVCVLASPAPAGAGSARVVVSAAFRDGFGNARDGPLAVPLTVYRAARPGCAVPTLDAPPAS